MVAVAVFGAFFAVIASVGFFAVQRLNIGAYVPPTDATTYLLILSSAGTLELLAASVIVAMLAKGKEKVATTLFAFTFLLVMVTADVTVHRQAILLAHPTYLIVNTILVAAVGVIVRKRRFRANVDS